MKWFLKCITKGRVRLPTKADEFSKNFHRKGRGGAIFNPKFILQILDLYKGFCLSFQKKLQYNFPKFRGEGRALGDVRNSDFLSFFSFYCKLLAEFLSDLGEWAKLIKFDVRWVFLHLEGWKTTNLTLYQNVCATFHVSSKYKLMLWITKCCKFTRSDSDITQKNFNLLRSCSENLTKKMLTMASGKMFTI